MLPLDASGALDDVERLRSALGLAPGDLHVTAPATPAEAARWLGSCDAVVTLQLHGTILAAVAATPAVAIGTDPALQSHARILGLSDLALRPDASTRDALPHCLERALEAHETSATALAARVDVARTLLAGAYEAALAAAVPAGIATAADRQRTELAAYERACGRLRSQLEQREESWRTLAGLLGQDAEVVEPVSAGVTQRSRDIRILRARAEAAEAELDAIKRTRGWRLLHRYGLFKYRYLLPIYRLLGRRPSPRSKSPSAPEDDPNPDHVPPGTYDVVCFPIIDWDFRFQRPQHLMARFGAAGHRVFYVSPWLTDSGEPFRLEEKAPNVQRVTLRGPRRNVWTEALGAADADRLLASLNRLRAEVSLGATLAVVQLPFWWPLAALARERFGWPVLYDCMDHHAGFATHTGATSADERALFAGADLVTISSAQLEQEARQHTSKLQLVRNGCEYEHFANARGVRGPRPVIGFYGAIADWFDGDLVADLAERRPDWDFLLVGSTDMGDVSRLEKLPNVRLPGEKPYAEIPAWLAKIDVTLLPFKRTPLTEATNPVKAYEILASGKPLVSVPLPEMIKLAPLVRLAATVDEFEREITAALEPEDDALIERRRAFARANTWEARFAELVAAVPATFPKASTVIVTYNNLEMTRRCLDALFACTEWPNHEVIVVDNASHDGTPDYLRAYAEGRPDMTVICNDDNRGFAAACNQGLAVAAGEYLVLLNNDTIPTRGWLSTLIRHLAAVPEIGLIGPATNEIGNESKVAVGYQGLDDMPGWAHRFTRENDDRLRSMSMLAMFCVAMRRQTFLEVGPLDERFAIGMFEDDDYSRRIRSHGYRIVCARDSFVHHAGGASFKLLDNERYRALFERNKRAFERKWGMWTPHQDDAALPRIAALRTHLAQITAHAGVRPQQVVVFLRSLARRTPPGERSYHLAEALARNGMLVFLDCSGDASEDVDGFREVERNLWLYAGPDGVLEQLESPLVWALPYNGVDAFRWLKRTIVYDLADSLAGFPFEERLLRENHDRLLREADVVVCASRGLLDQVRTRRPDAILLQNAAADACFASSREGVALDPAFETLRRDDRPVAVYHGVVDARFDVDLVESVARLRPEWGFAVFAQRRDDAPSLAALERRDNVRLLAPPPAAALPAYLARCTAGLLPLRVDGDTEQACPIALYELLATGTPVVSTPIADGADLDGVTIVSTPEEAATALARARARAGDPEWRTGLRRSVRDHTWTARAREIAALVRRRADDDLRRARAARRRRESPTRRHAARLAGRRFYRGTCNICGDATLFYFESEALYRESLLCVECLSTSRYRSLARGILRALGELVGVEATSLAELADLATQRRLRVYDTQVPFYWAECAYPLPDLLARCDWIDVHTSTYRPAEPLGRSLGTRCTNQDLAQLRFADESFDLVLTSDVMEHVRLDDRAHREIRRVLRPDGVYLFTVPHHRDRAETTVRVRVLDPDDPARDQHVMEPEYHGDANSEEDRALCYRTYGTELDRTLERLGFTVEYSKTDIPELGILDTELFYCRVTRAAYPATAEAASG